jgi:hypothetical protein
MTKRIIAASSLLSLMLSASPVLATPNFVPASLSTPGTERTLALPTQAGNSSVISLGESVDPTTGKVVEGLAFVHYGSTGSLQGKKGFEHKGKPHGKGKGGGDTGSVCYSFLANGTKWNVTENYIFDPTNSRGLDGVVLSGLLATSIESWDGEVSADVFGTEVVGVIDAASIGSVGYL